MRVAVIVDEFPALAETFILRQITGLLDGGHEVAIYANHRTPDATRHASVERYGLPARTRYVDAPLAAGYWEQPVRPLRGRTWLPGAATPISNARRAAAAAPVLARCALRAPRIVRDVLDPGRYAHQAESLSSLYRLDALLRARERPDVVHAHF